MLQNLRCLHNVAGVAKSFKALGLLQTLKNNANVAGVAEFLKCCRCCSAFKTLQMLQCLKKMLQVLQGLSKEKCCKCCGAFSNVAETLQMCEVSQDFGGICAVALVHRADRDNLQSFMPFKLCC